MNRNLLLVLALLLCAASVLGTPVAPTGIVVESTGSRTITGSSNISAQGGNVTELQINALSITKTWQGYWGNITGNIHLDDAGNQSFYVWGNATSLSGEIYASRSGAVDWTTVNCTNASQITAENTYLGVSASDGDSVTNTFNSLNHPTFIVGSNTISNNSCHSTNVFVNGTSQGTQFYQILLSDNSSNTIYTTLLENNQYAYNSQKADFQLMVGENEHDGNIGPTTYFFYTELS